ncbi:hypothetical protein L228DRAFT_156863 [Xylona heveae TC161]|uniref:Subtilisin-like serine protease n=1 Tax=Xylona heveae (strain CBS 132557 / TC161) TaxID=1328760 RepID=A0A165G1W3_XYLHT|nr:hypothetical protein L228DRAFT_156863 [Xylona heveae TC161]KZF21643.1 hypothetical protein L228DRAFT_156863 [Xylona heveae TC161]
MLYSLPFVKCYQLCSDLDDTATPSKVKPTTTLPGHPYIKLDTPSILRSFLEKELYARDLEAIAPYLWVMSTQSSSNINPLHRQKVKGREIVVTEDPRLHLVWIHDRIFIKPLPRYLLSYAFWDLFLSGKSTELGDLCAVLRSAALGYLRTYRYLIQHETDFFIAQQEHLRLVPKDVDWPRFCDFISELDRVRDVDVSGRYCYGEIRLSRLNFYAPFLLRRFYYEQVHGQYSDIFGRFYGPVLFVFAVVTTLLNSMQVGMAVEQVSSEHWVAFWTTSRWFSILSLTGTALIALAFILLWMFIFIDEWIYAIKCLRKRRREEVCCT